MKYVFLIILFILCVSLAYSDEFKIPYSCYPKDVQKIFSEHGYKLDLNGVDRDKESWGFIDNKGSNYSIFSYQPTTEKEWNDMLSIILKLYPAIENQVPQPDPKEFEIPQTGGI